MGCCGANSLETSNPYHANKNTSEDISRRSSGITLPSSNASKNASRKDIKNFKYCEQNSNVEQKLNENDERPLNFSPKENKEDIDDNNNLLIINDNNNFEEKKSSKSENEFHFKNKEKIMEINNEKKSEKNSEINYNSNENNSEKFSSSDNNNNDNNNNDDEYISEVKSQKSQKNSEINNESYKNSEIKSNNDKISENMSIKNSVKNSEKNSEKISENITIKNSEKMSEKNSVLTDKKSLFTKKSEIKSNYEEEKNSNISDKKSLFTKKSIKNSEKNSILNEDNKSQISNQIEKNEIDNKSIISKISESDKKTEKSIINSLKNENKSEINEEEKKSEKKSEVNNDEEKKSEKKSEINEEEKKSEKSKSSLNYIEKSEKESKVNENLTDENKEKQEEQEKKNAAITVSNLLTKNNNDDITISYEPENKDRPDFIAEQLPEYDEYDSPPENSEKLTSNLSYIKSEKENDIYQITFISKELYYTKTGIIIDEFYTIKGIKEDSGSYICSEFFCIKDGDKLIKAETDAEIKVEDNVIKVLNFKVGYNEEKDFHIVYEEKCINLFTYHRADFLQELDNYQGAVIVVKLHVPNCLRLFDYNKKFFKKESENLYTYEGIIPKNGIKEKFEATYYRIKGKFHAIAEAPFNVEELNNLMAIMPLYYKQANNKIINYNIHSNKSKEIDNYFNTENENDHTIESKSGKLKLTYKNIFVQAFGELEKNIDNEFIVINEKKHYFTIDKKTKKDFKKHAEKILKESKYKNEPDFYKIGKWVNENMTYSLKYHGKKFTAYEIWKNRIGVCEHYTLLYNTLLTSIDIPVCSLTGTVCNNNEDRFGRHAWTLAKIDGKWMQLDATWDHFSGGVPISHIFKNYANDTMKFEYY